jgi:hypothetical protein
MSIHQVAPLVPRKVRLGLAVLLLSASATSVAAGDEKGPQQAESLFRNGKELLAQQDYARACPLLAESYRLDPATGSLLALAICHEGQGKVAAALAEYGKVVTRSQRESRPDREKAAREKAKSLEAQVSMLTINVEQGAQQIDGIQVKRNGVVVGSSAWGTPIPVDGGEQIVEASAPGMTPWRATVSIAAKVDSKEVTVPLLEPKTPERPAPKAVERATPKVSDEAPKPAALPPPPTTAIVVPTESRTEEHPSSRGTALQGAGIATTIAGVVTLGIGAGFLVRAIGKNSDSKAGCDGNVCSIQGTQDRWEAQDAGNVATISFIAGGVLAAGGTMMFLLGRPRRTLTACAGSTCIGAVPTPVDHGFGGVLQGSFW